LLWVVLETALARFAALFLGKLWDVYGRRGLANGPIQRRREGSGR
jgi:hypothetical protein